MNPHPSHVMGDWEDTVVTISSTSRFGSIRTCQNCGGEHAKTVAGEAMHDELYKRCEAVPLPTTREEYRQLPMATYPEIDVYMERAGAFLKMASKGHPELVSLTQTAVGEYMAFLDGKRIRKY